MPATARNFRYPGYGDSAAIPDYFFNLATDVQGEFDRYDPYVAGLIAEADTRRANGDNNLSTNINTANQLRQDGDTALSNRIDALTQSSSWGPTLGGTGATLGNNGGAEGQINRSREECTFRGRLVFGSSASFGTGVASIGGISFGLRTQTAFGTGYYTDGNFFIHVVFTPLDSTTFAIRRQKNDGNLGLGYDLGTPPQSSQLVFAIGGVRA